MTTTEKPLTPRQAELLQFVETFRALHGHMPTKQHAADSLGIERHEVYRLIDGMGDLIDWKPNQGHRVITPQQANLLAWIAAFHAGKGYMPTVREMMDGMGISSPNGVMCHLHPLRRKGYLTWENNRARTIKILKSI